ncbi:hypothetical protein LINGRAHAP2_LOCUS19970 [Linum grandiflorum]
MTVLMSCLAFSHTALMCYAFGVTTLVPMLCLCHGLMILQLLRAATSRAQLLLLLTVSCGGGLLAAFEHGRRLAVGLRRRQKREGGRGVE